MARIARPCHLFVPLVPSSSVLWVALIIAGAFVAADLPQSMGCADPGAAPLSMLLPRLGPCQVGAPLTPSLPRRHHHDTHHEDQSPV
jgi:hypothetical protein